MRGSVLPLEPWDELLSDSVGNRLEKQRERGCSWLADNAGSRLHAWLQKVQAYIVSGWVGDSDGDVPPVREVADDLSTADVVSSLLLELGLDGERRHHIVLDIDYPAHVIESSTPGHHHVIIEVPDGIEHNAYMDLLERLGKLHVIEPGYARASIQRGHSDIRLPWVRKS